MQSKSKNSLLFWLFYILVFVLGILAGAWLVKNKSVKIVGATQVPLVCASQCIASECGTTTGAKYEVQESFEYADGICPIFYHWQNEGNWQQRCHKNFSWVSPAFVEPWACPSGFSHVGNNCQKSVFSCGQVSCNTAEVIQCAGECPVACGLEASTVPDGDGGEIKCDATEACPIIPPPVVKQEYGYVAAPQCQDKTPLILPSNVHVVRNGANATVNFFTNSSNANIYYKEVSSTVWQHSVRDISVTGGYVSYTIKALNPALGYTFGVQAANSCAGGETVLAVIVDGPKDVTFPLSYWMWLR